MQARLLFWNELQATAELDLPGMWVLHREDVFLPELDIHRAGQETIAIPSITMEFLVSYPNTGFSLRYDGDLPPPDFDEIAYWEDKLEKLKTKRKRVEREV